MESNRRKVVKDYSGFYQLLKPKENGRWHGYGKRKSLKAISDIERGREFELEISEDVIEEIRRYRRGESERERKYRSREKSLEARTVYQK